MIQPIATLILPTSGFESPLSDHPGFSSPSTTLLNKRGIRGRPCKNMKPSHLKWPLYRWDSDYQCLAELPGA